ncbi:hypothetical protein B2G88_12220 [Natronolimnobius baerhuensis]|uniref:Uncharacterized protein n=2 Tax=Natronolimnobius baerhuensis TaxID=253108 RepID=A0A202EA21_9EURY|nr:hypothetical protein B2G88_12220 [Natronolimnobius baerhuensis]
MKAESAEFIEDKAEEWYGSSYDQGRVVDRLISDFNRQESIKTEISEIKEMLEENEEASSQASFSVQGVGGSEVDEEELEELLQLANEGEAIDTAEYDISLIKGVQGIDRDEVVYAALRGESQNAWTKKEVRNYIMDEVGYAKGSANDIANTIIRRHMIDSPFNNHGEWLDDLVETDIENNFAKLDDTASDKAYRRNYSTLADYADIDDEWSNTVYHVSDEQAAEHMLMLALDVHKTVRNGDNLEQKRGLKVMDKVISQSGDLLTVDVYNGEYASFGDHLLGYIGQVDAYHSQFENSIERQL